MWEHVDSTSYPHSTPLNTYNYCGRIRLGALLFFRRENSGTEAALVQHIFIYLLFMFGVSTSMQDPAVTRRVMDIYKFMNSKVLFKHLRHNGGLFASTKPVMVHVNYHPDKYNRMLAVWAKYVDGDEHALDPFPDGSEE